MNTIDLTTIRGAFSFLNRLSREELIELPGPGEHNAAGLAIERITGRPVSAWVSRWWGRSLWTAEALCKSLREQLQLMLSQRLCARRWAIQLMVNGRPVSENVAVHAVIVYNPKHAGDLMSFVSAVRIAANNSRHCQTKLLIRHAESCSNDVMEYMARMLNNGMTLADGTRTEFDPERLVVELKLNPTNDAAWRLVDYIIEYRKPHSQ